jgi:hypothetical protein
MANSWMTLAYMAELGAVFNLAYMELKATRYYRLALNDVRDVLHQVGESNNEEKFGTAAELYVRVKNIFSTDTDERIAAWCIKKGQTPKKFKFTAGRIYPLFAPRGSIKIEDIMRRSGHGEEEDHSSWARSICSWLLCITVASLIGITVCSYSNVDANPYGWWICFAVFLASILVPALLVFVGRKMAEEVEELGRHLRDEFNELQLANVTKATQQALSIGTPRVETSAKKTGNGNGKKNGAIKR